MGGRVHWLRPRTPRRGGRARTRGVWLWQRPPESALFGWLRYVLIRLQTSLMWRDSCYPQSKTRSACSRWCLSLLSPCRVHAITGMQLARTTLVWHMRTKRRTAYRVAYAHHWSEVEGRHCAPPPLRRWMRCGRMRDRAMTVSCAGARWVRCTTRLDAYTNLTRCTALEELKQLAHLWRLAFQTV